MTVDVTDADAVSRAIQGATTMSPWTLHLRYAEPWQKC